MALRDARELSDGAVIDADVCIVGGGPAGISLALSLLDTSQSIVLLESGGSEDDPESQQLNVGVNAGLPYYELHETRHRGLGGASERWAGWCRPLDRADIGARDWTGSSGWPLTFEELWPYYEEAAALCEIPAPLTTGTDENLPAVYRRPFTGNGVGTATWQLSPPTKFGRRYRGDLEASKTLTVYLHATAVEVSTNPEGTTATGVSAIGGTGSRFTVRAATIVLTAGAIETARLLLASRGTHSNGLGNLNDLVGRNFMEHPHLVTARLALLPPEVTGRPYVKGIDSGILGTKDRLAMQRPTGSRKVAFVIDEGVRTREHLLNFSTHIRTVSKVDRENSKTYQAFKLVVNNLRSPSQLVAQARSGSLPKGSGKQVGYMLRGMPELAQVIYQEALKRPTELALYTQSEQVPNAESRVTLDPRNKDATGLPRVRLDWRLSRIDKESIIASHEILAHQFLASGLGVLVPEPAFQESDDDWGTGLRGGHHHMGTARMAHDPRHGVVDPDCQVHGVRGLFVGDSAVFPSGGFANPLLTTVALALRLGARLRGMSA